MRRTFLLAAAGLIGCNRPTPQPVPDVVVAAAEQPDAVAPVPPAPTPDVPPAVPPAPPAPPPVFAFPADLAGKELPRVVAPPAPAALPAERYGAAPLARTPPARVVSPDPLAKRRYALPPLLPPKPAGLKPVAPAERAPLDLGVAAAVPARPSLPVTPGAVAKSRDAAVPPDLAPLGRAVPDRASLDDPTADVANAAIVSRTPTPALPPAAFQKVTLPDPFELGEQVKPKVAPAADPGRTPVPVNPQRPK